MADQAKLAIASNEYNLDKFLAVLRAYQLQPTEFDIVLASQILMTTMTRLRDPDFTLCLCLIADKHHNTPEITELCALQDLVARCKFQQFWSAWADAKSRLPTPPPHFDENLRRNIVCSFSVLQSVEVSVLLAALNSTDASIITKLGGSAVKAVGKEHVTFTTNKFNTPEPPAAQRMLTSNCIAELVA